MIWLLCTSSAVIFAQGKKIEIKFFYVVFFLLNGCCFFFLQGPFHVITCYLSSNKCPAISQDIAWNKDINNIMDSVIYPK